MWLSVLKEGRIEDDYLPPFVAWMRDDILQVCCHVATTTITTTANHC